MTDIVRATLLYDYYGSLLTKHQQEVFENVVFSDLSLAEAAGEYGISRQGVHDMIRRCTASMEDFEERLGLIKNGQKISLLTKEIEDLSLELKAGTLFEEDSKKLDRIAKLARTLREDD